LSSEENKPSESDFDREINPDFIEENKRLNLFQPRPKLGTFTKKDRKKRRKAVYRLHFECGISARKIAEMMNVDKNAINYDIKLIYEELRKESNATHYDYINKQIDRIEMQHSRLISYLRNTKDLRLKLIIERQLADIDFKLLAAVQKLEMSTVQFYDRLYDAINEYFEENKFDYRVFGPYQSIGISSRGYSKILRILKKEGLARSQ
jgi:transposase